MEITSLSGVSPRRWVEAIGWDALNELYEAKGRPGWEASYYAWLAPTLFSQNALHHQPDHHIHKDAQ